ncbi:Na+/H+ antiporter subunit D [Bacillus massiliglaciei]|uniref:Na+/H+ antiporter subunit D n=1 Tax=Bacillus massiliglaciei TaxID=1816693 RepID=UPI000B1EFFDD|nr:Na+/H+ antiporter subunit D [Bacillus massiliglaciei]
MNNLIILPIVIPLLCGIVMLIFQKRIKLQRLAGILGLVLVSAVSVILIRTIHTEGILVLHAGGWKAPYGISFAADMFSALLLLTANIVALCCYIFSFKTIGSERERHYYYPLFLFLIAGVNGSFLTGDIFNLFVCFEVMLISSYVLLALGGTRRQLRGSLKYILINLLSSFLFLIAVAYLYSALGTLNFAHLSVRVEEAGQDGLLTAISLLFLIVFSIKAALLLFFWLPDSYGSAPSAIAALFSALLTKVGLYAIFRLFTLIFYHEPQVTHLIIGIMAALTMLLGAFGAVAYGDIRKILTYNVIIGAGFIAAGLAAFNHDALLGALYYLIHDIIIKALLFMIGGVIILLTGTSRLKEMGGLISTHPYLGWSFFIGALSLSGIPPLSGFLGKVFITEGTFEAGHYWLGAIGLLTSLMILYSVMKIFMNSFWGGGSLGSDKEAKGAAVALPIGILTALTVLLGIGAEGIMAYAGQAADELLDPAQYIKAVLGK